MQKTTKVASAYGFMGHGWTAKEARDDVEAKVARFCADTKNFTPIVIVVHGYSALLWRTQECWTYSLYRFGNGQPEQPGQVKHTMSQSESHSVTDTLLSAIRHLTGLAWHHGVSDDAEFVVDAFARNRIRCIPEEALQAAILDSIESAKWQRGYKKAADEGLGDMDCRHAADRYREAYREQRYTKAA